MVLTRQLSPSSYDALCRKEEQLAKEKEEERKQKVLDSLEQKLQQFLHESSSSSVQRRKRKKRSDFLALAIDRSLGIMASMDQKDFFALIVVNGSCMVKAGFTGYVAPRAFSLWSVCRPVMFGIMADMDQKVYCETCAGRRHWQWPVYGWVLLDSSPRAEFPFLVCRPRCSASWPV